MSTETTARTKSITLKGSALIVAEFFGYSINSILYQRGIYDPDTFNIVKKYGLPMHVTLDESLSNYLKQVLKQLVEWLSTGDLKKLILVLQDMETKEVVERWAFDIETDEDVVNDPKLTKSKDPKEIRQEIAAIIRQITASVTFLPLIEKQCTFDILIYTKNDTEFPNTWEISDPLYIPEANEVKLRSFSTKVHSVHTSVVYKVDADDE